MTANGQKITAGAAAQIDAAIANLLDAQRLVAGLQEQIRPMGARTNGLAVTDTNALWHALETIDDRIHEALSKLGD